MITGVFFSNDPGGTNAIIPVAREMSRRPDFRNFHFATSHAIPLWNESGLEFITLREDESYKIVPDRLRKIKPDFILTGTSEDPSRDAMFWKAARQLQIPSFSVIDHWTRYRERYLLDGAFSPTDIVFTLDEHAKKEMVRLGFDEKKIVVSGQPHFEKFAGYMSPLSFLQYTSANALSQKKIITFVSDIISTSFPNLSFNEQTTLHALLSALESFPEMANEYQLVVKLHPKEPADSLATVKQPRNLDVNILRGGNNLDLLYHSSFVIGMFSMMLFEAFLMGKPVLSMQLNAEAPTRFGPNTIPLVTDPGDLPKTLRNFLTHTSLSNATCVSNSTTKIIDVIREVAGKE